MKKILFSMVTILIAGAATAKLPPLSDEAKVKAAEAQAIASHRGTKVFPYQLCLAQNKVAAKFGNKSQAVALGPCVNPGSYVSATAGASAAADKK
ncbi:MAG: hypothetical protein ACI83P_001959 [Janthinobacterium sp.]|jgi:hypothetical protein